MVKRKTNHFSPFLIISYISKSLSLNDTLSQVCLNWPSDFWDGSRFLKVANFFFTIYLQCISTRKRTLPIYSEWPKDVGCVLWSFTQRCFEPSLVEIGRLNCQCIFTVYLPLETFSVLSWLDLKNNEKLWGVKVCKGWEWCGNYNECSLIKKNSGGSRDFQTVQALVTGLGLRAGLNIFHWTWKDWKHNSSHANILYL